MEIFLGNMAYFLKEESKNFTSLYWLQYQKMPREAKSSLLNTGGLEVGWGETQEYVIIHQLSEAKMASMYHTQLLQPMADSVSPPSVLQYKALGGHHQ